MTPSITRHDEIIAKLEQRIRELESTVKKWEDHEIEKASCCARNEEAVKRLEAERDRLKAHLLELLDHAIPHMNLSLKDTMWDRAKQIREQLDGKP